MNEYEEFLEWAETHDFEFPCTAGQFVYRARQFAAGDEELVALLCERGIGPDWNWWE